jgi:hypothetical protein
MFGSDPSEPLNINHRKEEGSTESKSTNPAQPKSEAQVVPLNAAISISATTIVQIDMREAIVFMLLVALVLYLMIQLMRSARTFSAL